MENTGRIQSSILPLVQRMLFEKEFNISVEELRIASEVDQAHLLMLAERGIVSRERAARLMRAIERLCVSDFAQLLNRPASRGTYFLYEDYLIETEGVSVGGILQTARSRNDLNATIHKMKMRGPWIALLREGLRLQAVLLRRARRYQAVVMPAYTHGQAAAPSTFGHYLAGIAHTVDRHLCAFHEAGSDIHCCPLGAGAVAGTNLPIDTERTASLLGFERSSSNSIDAVASRDLALRLVAEAAILGTTLSRFATDLLTWCSEEFGFITLPDEVVGSSSAMPQKRNPFLLEHVQGLASSALGGFVAAAGAMHAKPFTNSIAVGTEAPRAIWGSLQDTTNALILCRLVVARAYPNTDAMLRRAEEGDTMATALANRIAHETNLDFRTSHHLVGEFVREKKAHVGNSRDVSLSGFLRSRGIYVSLERLDPAAVVADSRWGGGPAGSSIEHSVDEITAQWRLLVRAVRSTKLRWALSRRVLQEEANRMQQPVEAFKPEHGIEDIF